jgi:hypothetical protein
MPRALFPNRPTGQLVAWAQAALGMTHKQFGEALHASERTSIRWASGRSQVGVSQLHMLARLVYPKNPALAAQLAEAGSETLESLGVVSAPRPTLAPQVLADVVACAAADAIGVAPAAARKALAAAFARAKELGATAAEVESALAATPPPPPPRQSPPSA